MNYKIALQIVAQCIICSASRNCSSGRNIREKKIIPEIKTVKNYEIALEEATYKWITEGEEEPIITLLQDAKESNMLPKIFYSEKNYIHQSKRCCRLMIDIKKGRIELRMIKGSSSKSKKNTKILEQLTYTLRKIRDIYNC